MSIYKAHFLHTVKKKKVHSGALAAHTHQNTHTLSYNLSLNSGYTIIMVKYNNTVLACP